MGPLFFGIALELPLLAWARCHLLRYPVVTVFKRYGLPLWPSSCSIVCIDTRSFIVFSCLVLLTHTYFDLFLPSYTYLADF